MAYVCIVCDIPTFTFCGKCQIVCYCSKLCQRIHNKQHKCLPILTKEYLETHDKIESPVNDDIIDDIDPFTLVNLNIHAQSVLKKVISGINICIMKNNTRLALILLDKCRAVRFYVPRTILSSICLVNSIVLVMIKDNINALEELRKAIRLDPKNSTAYFNLSIFYINMKDVNVLMMLQETSLKLKNKVLIPVPLCMCGTPYCQKCTICELVCYCSDECQHKDLINHKKNCVKKLSIREINIEKEIFLKMESTSSGTNKLLTSPIYDMIIANPDYISEIKITSGEEFNNIYDAINTAISKNKPIIALQLLNKCSSIYSNLPYKSLSGLYLIKGRVLIRLKQYTEGYSLLQESIYFDKYNIESYLDIAHFYEIADKHKKASIIKNIPNTLQPLCICEKISSFICVNCRKAHYCSK